MYSQSHLIQQEHDLAIHARRAKRIAFCVLWRFMILITGH